METNNQNFQDWLKQNNKSQRTIETYTVYQKKLQKQNQQEIINQQTINNFFSNPKNNQTVGRAFMKKYLKYKNIPLNEIEFPEPAKREKKLTAKRYLTEEETQQLVKKLKQEGYQEQALGVMIMFETGIRITELLNLTEQNIDYTNKQIKGIGKGNVEYQAYLSEECINTLRIHVAWKKMEYKKIGIPLKQIFSGSRWNWTNFLKNKGRKDFNLPITSHWCRHSSITDYINKGGTLQEAQIYARHSNIDTTLRYLHNINAEQVRQKRKQMLEQG